MFNINRNDMTNATKQPDAKIQKASTDDAVYDSFKLSIANVIDTLKGLSVYDMAQWINHIDRWIKNKNVNNTYKYGRGCIVLLDLGAQNFRYEPSYTHPGIIIAETKYMALVVPCSSKRYGKGYSGIIDATPADGFSSNTGVQVDSFRWVNKNRIISAVGRTSSSVLDKIDEYILDLTPTYKRKKAELNAEIERLKAELDKLNNNQS